MEVVIVQQIVQFYALKIAKRIVAIDVLNRVLTVTVIVLAIISVEMAAVKTVVAVLAMIVVVIKENQKKNETYK